MLRTDVKSYRASIAPGLLVDQLAEHIMDKRVLNRLCPYLRQTAKRVGVFQDNERSLDFLGYHLNPAGQRSPN